MKVICGSKFTINKLSLSQMASKVVTLQMMNDYPFSISSDYQQPRTTVQVKKTLALSFEIRPTIKQKIRLLKTMNSKHLVTLLATQEEQEQVHLIFQYVHRKLDTEILSFEESSIQQIKSECLALATIWAQHGVVHEIKSENIGLSPDGHLKYFLGFNFKIDKYANKQELNHSYHRVIEELFGYGGRFSRRVSPFRHSKNQYGETMDTTQANYHHCSSLSPIVNPRLAMKKSATMLDTIHSDQKNSRLLQSTDINQAHYVRETTNDIKAIRIEDIGARINKLKNYVKDLTGRSPKNGFSHLTVKVDKNLNNRIMQESKMFISPNYTKIQKKIAEWRESKFYRAFGHQEILYQDKGKGYQLESTEVITPKHHNPEIKSIDLQQCKTKTVSTPTSKDHQPKPLPKYLFKKNRSDDEEKKKDSREEESLNSSKNKVNTGGYEGSYENQYRKLGHTDKYCEQFMYFLDDDPVPQQKGEMSPLTQLISKIGHDQLRKQEQQFSSHSNNSNSTSTEVIKTRVKKAIRNSLKLINGIKYRQSHD